MSGRRRAAAATAFLSWLAVGCGPAAPHAVGSKAFTESVILGEILTLLARDGGVDVRHRRELGGTTVLWNAIVSGAIDAYPDYTGTLIEEVLAGEEIETDADLERALAEHGIGMTRRIGFENRYALGMRRDLAEELGIRRISDLRGHPELRLRFASEFLDRADGWPALRERYSLPHDDVLGVDHDISYRGIESGAADVTVLYTTDAELRHLDLAILDDDLGHFPEYDAVLLHRLDLPERCPALLAAARALEGAISTDEMIAMNARARIERVPEARVAAEFLSRELGVAVSAPPAGRLERLRRTTLDHLFLVSTSLAAAIAASLPLGIWAARSARAAPWILGIAGVIQTVPALALLVFLMPLLDLIDLPSLGEPPAIAALFLYSLLPIVRNTCAGIQGIAPSLTESARALGLPPAARLRLVELPLASPMILAGIKTAAVINIGFATLGALIGAGGYGQPILTGIRLDDLGLILEGAVPAASMALGAQGLFALAERRLVPRGLRL